MPKSTFDNLPDDKRQRIIDVALEEFASQPYHQASLSRIVERAGIAKGSMYQYFEDKFDLYVYLVTLTADIKMRYVREAIESLPPVAGFYELMSAAAEAGLQMARDNPWLQRLGDRMMSESDEFLYALLSRFGAAKDATMDSWIRDAHQRGDIDRRIQPGVASYIIQAVFMSMGRDMAAGRLPRESVIPMFRQVMDVLQYGMRPREGRGDERGGRAESAPGKGKQQEEGKA